MTDKRPRLSRFRRLSRWLALLLLLCALWRLMTPVAAALNPLWSTAGVSCTPLCSMHLDPVRLLDREMRDSARTQPGVAQRIEQGLDAPGARSAIAAARALKALPEILFFLALAFAARAFARTGIERRALGWLRMAMWSAVAWPLTGALAHAVNSAATTPMVTGQREVHLGIYPQDLILGLVVAGGLRLVIWALEEALTLRSDMDDYV